MPAANTYFGNSAMLPRKQLPLWRRYCSVGHSIVA